MTTLREAAQQALEALVAAYQGKDKTGQVTEAITALRERLAQPVQEPVDSPKKAGAYMDARLWEFIDMAAAWPEAKLDPRTWDHVLVYAPEPPEQEPVAWMHTDPDNTFVCFLEWRENEPGYRGRWIKTPLYTAPPQRKPLTDKQIDECWYQSGGLSVRFARAIERAHGIGEQQ